MGQYVIERAQELTADEWREVREAVDIYFGFLPEQKRRSLARELSRSVQLRPGAFGFNIDLRMLAEAVVREIRQRRNRE